MPISGWGIPRTTPVNKPDRLEDQHRRLTTSSLMLDNESGSRIALQDLSGADRLKTEILESPIAALDEGSRLYLQDVTVGDLDFRSAIIATAPIAEMDDSSRLSMLLLKEIDLRPVLANELGYLITTHAGEPIRVY